MRAERLCHKVLAKTSIHSKRLAVISEVVETAVINKTLSVTQLGRKMLNRNKSRSNIRKVDRLYSNENLCMEKENVYQAICKTMIKCQRPFITIDGSKLPNSPWYILRACLVSNGRGITLYEKQYESTEQGDRKLYKSFLNGLARVLGTEVSPILITDAEFRGPWFELVRHKGWDFIGRLRGSAKVSTNEIDEPDDWQELWSRATHKPKYLGEGFYNRTDEVSGHFYLFKGKNKGRHTHTRSGRQSKTVKSNRQRISAREPWLLISSLEATAAQIINAYKLRMTIEENFRDTKSGRYGLGLRMTFSKVKNRYTNMLIIAALASLIAYLIGCVGEQLGLMKEFQANSTKNKRVISRFFLGCEMAYKRVKIRIKDWQQAIENTQRETISWLNS
jgi:hypothetical protein